jgi:hypothetical protein
MIDSPTPPARPDENLFLWAAVGAVMVLVALAVWRGWSWASRKMPVAGYQSTT